jgi:Flp pilus assembly pilin Flp
MIKFIKNFRKDENGAVTVDWVVLTAAVVALAAVAYNGISGGASGLAGTVNSTLSNATVTIGEAGGLGSGS